MAKIDNPANTTEVGTILNSMEKSFRDAVFFGSGVLSIAPDGEARHVPREEYTGVTHYRGYVITARQAGFEIRLMGVLMSRRFRPTTLEAAKAFVDEMRDA